MLQKDGNGARVAFDEWMHLPYVCNEVGNVIEFGSFFHRGKLAYVEATEIVVQHVANKMIRRVFDAMAGECGLGLGDVVVAKSEPKTLGYRINSQE